MDKTFIQRSFSPYQGFSRYNVITILRYYELIEKFYGINGQFGQYGVNGLGDIIFLLRAIFFYWCPVKLKKVKIISPKPCKYGFRGCILKK